MPSGLLRRCYWRVEMTDKKDASARTQAIHDATMDLDAAPAVDITPK
jgi:hypothetical protein